MTPKIAWNIWIAIIVAGWVGLGLVVAWAVYTYGADLFSGTDAAWIVPLALVIIMLFILYGVIYFIRIFNPAFLNKTRASQKAWKKVPLAALSLTFIIAGSFMFLGAVSRDWSVHCQYLATRERITSTQFLSDPARVARKLAIAGIMADYDLEPRLSGVENVTLGPGADARVDVDALVHSCEALGINCYHFLIWHRDTDWLDFQAFVVAAENSPILASRNFTVWIYLVPPSESRVKESEPFGQDYIAWMGNVSLFSEIHHSVTAVCIDDFYSSSENRDLFTSEYMDSMRAAADEHDESLAIVSCLYWDSVDPARPANTWAQATAIAPCIDGILYPYMDESTGDKNHVETASLCDEIARVREIYPEIPVILDIYASKHSGCAEKPNSTYIAALLDGSRACCDGVALYCGPKINMDGTIAPYLGGMEDPEAIFSSASSKFTSWY